MKILLTHSYFLHLDSKQWKQQKPYPPLGTLYAAAMLNATGHHVSFADMMFVQDARQIDRYLVNEQPQIFIIYDDGFNYLTKMCLTKMREACFEMIKLAKEKGCTIIVSSSDSTDHSKEYLNCGADFIIVGEGEVTLLELVTMLMSNENDFSNIHGIRFLMNDEVVATSSRPVVKDLDSLPMPLWSLMDMAPYKKAWRRSTPYFSLNITTTRGCPFKCNWCAKPIYGNRYNSRSPANVVEEIVWLQRNYGNTHIWFCDDIFGLKPGWIKEFAREIISRQISIKYKIQCRADLLLEEDNIGWLAQSGCEEVWIGAESGSQKILDAMDKGITIEQIQKASSLLKKHGIKPCFFLQFGYPGETMDDIRKTIKMVETLDPYDIGVSVSYPLPGTVFFEKVKEELKEKSNWTDSDDLALMFTNNYPASFYRELHRFLHRHFRSRRALESVYALAKFSSIKPNVLRSALSFPYHKARKWVHQQHLKAHDFNIDHELL